MPCPSVGHFCDDKGFKVLKLRPSYSNQRRA
jgi:hypothetical protein